MYEVDLFPRLVGLATFHRHAGGGLVSEGTWDVCPLNGQGPGHGVASSVRSQRNLSHTTEALPRSQTWGAGVWDLLALGGPPDAPRPAAANPLRLHAGWHTPPGSTGTTSWKRRQGAVWLGLHAF